MFDNIHEAYLGVLSDIYYKPDFISSPRGLKIREQTNYVFSIINPTSEAIVTKDKERNVKIAEYTKKEVDLYNSMSNSASDFAKASSFWNKIANPDGTINSAYGYLLWGNQSFGNPYYEFHGHEMMPQEVGYGMKTPWDWAKQSLIRDRDTRQAFVKFSLPSHHWYGNKDQTCTMHGNFLIREDELSLTIVMRSNDVVLGLAYDLPWFCSLIDKMLKELLPTYPSLRKGAYTHIAHSMHMYEKNSDMVLRMMGV